MNGFKNDVDNFIPFVPNYLNRQGELVGVVQASEVVEWFRNNENKIDSLPLHIKALRSMEMEDNPLVMIGR